MVIIKQQKPQAPFIPEGYNYRRGYFLNLEYKYCVNGYLLGRRITFRYGNVLLSVVVPSLIEENNIAVLKVPWLFDSYGVNLDDWG